MRYFDISRLKIFLIVSAVLIAFSSLYVSHQLTRDLAQEEKGKMEVWADAMQAFNTADEKTDLNLVLRVLNGNNTIPVMVTDCAGNIQTYRNIKVSSTDSIGSLTDRLELMKEKGNVIRIDLSVEDDYLDVYYEDSLMLTRLAIYPYVQLAVVLIFVLVALFALMSSKRAEQNKVWVGLSKETAHQLGTPISSLMAWMELLKTNYPDDQLLPSMSEDVERLRMIANRFSKIGSAPELQPVDLCTVLSDVADYMSHRTSNKVEFSLNLPDTPMVVPLNDALFGWVIENLCKNAIDAMDGAGKITISVCEDTSRWIIDVADTGKGIPKNKLESVFAPGYTTKKRGWGLGLSLARRIVQEYHNGRIYIKQSELQKGTVFRIELKK